MAKILAIARGHEYRGSFTNNKHVWNAIEEMEGKKPTKSTDPIENLVIVDRRGKIEGTLPSGATEYFNTLTYAHFCAVLREEGKVALHDANDFTPVYGIWLGELNVIYSEENEDD